VLRTDRHGMSRRRVPPDATHPKVSSQAAFLNGRDSAQGRYLAVAALRCRTWAARRWEVWDP